MTGDALYRESQALAGWIWAVFLGVVLLTGAVALLRLQTTVTPRELSVRYGWLYSTRIPFSEIARAEAIQYRPIRDYGGWGIRGFGRRRALNARGNQGVLITRTDGRTLLIGSQRPRELLDALRRAGVATQDRLPVVVRQF